MNSFWNPEDKLSERMEYERESIIRRSTPVCVPTIQYKGIRKYFPPIKNKLISSKQIFFSTTHF